MNKTCCLLVLSLSLRMTVSRAISANVAQPFDRVECTRGPDGSWVARDANGSELSPDACGLPYERELQEIFWPRGMNQAARLRQLKEARFDAAIISEPNCTTELSRFGCQVDRLWVKPTHPLHLKNGGSEACAQQAIQQIREAMADAHLVACLQARALRTVRLTVLMTETELFERAHREGLDQVGLEAGELQFRALALWGGAGKLRCVFSAREDLQRSLCP